MADAGTPAQQMPRQDDDLLRRVKVLEQQMQQTQAAAAGAQAVAGLASNQLIPDTSSSSLSSYALTTGGITLASLTFTVPAGYTRALVYAVASITSGTNSTGGDTMFGVVSIAGSGGVESPTFMPTANPFGAICAVHTRTVTGLSGGSTVAVSCAARLTTGPGNTLVSRAVLTAMALYLK